MLFKKLAAEFFGTFILVFIAVGVATESFGFKLFGTSVAAGVVATALAFGLVLMALAYAIGPISGCHVNPAVTLGFVAAGRMKVEEALGFWVAQFAGAIAGAAALWQIFEGVPTYSRKVQGLGTDGWGKASLLHLTRAPPSASRWCSPSCSSA
jgi:aquaporin Z